MTAHRAGRLQQAAALAAFAVAISAAAPAASAADRPYVATDTAAAEEDDDAVWSIETTAQRLGPVRGATAAAEYAFDPATSMQIELGRSRDRAAGVSVSAAELEAKYLFNHIARDGYGWGVVAALGFEKNPGEGWQREQWSLKLPFTLSLWGGDGFLHLNAGASKPRDARREWSSSVALEREVWKRTTLFAELAREGEAVLAHAGVRHWIKRERFALDFSVLQRRAGGARESGFVIGLGWYDL